MIYIFILLRFPFHSNKTHPQRMLLHVVLLRQDAAFDCRSVSWSNRIVYFYSLLCFVALCCVVLCCAVLCCVASGQASPSNLVLAGAAFERARVGPQEFPGPEGFLLADLVLAGIYGSVVVVVPHRANGRIADTAGKMGLGPLLAIPVPVAIEPDAQFLVDVDSLLEIDGFALPEWQKSGKSFVPSAFVVKMASQTCR